MKKCLIHLMKGILVLFLIGLIAFFVIEAKAPKLAAKHLSEKLKVPVSIGDISLSLNNIELKELNVDNVPNSRLPKALSIRKANSHANLFKYLDKKVVIEEIAIDGIYLGLEFDSAKGTKGNWTVLMKNLQSGQTPTPKEKAQSVLIKELILTNIQVEVFYKSSGGTVKKLPLIPQIVLHNINSAEGLSAQEIMQTVLGQMLKSVFVEENLKNMFEGVLEQPQNAIDNLLQPFKGLF